MNEKIKSLRLARFSAAPSRGLFAKLLLMKAARFFFRFFSADIAVCVHLCVCLCVFVCKLVGDVASCRLGEDVSLGMMPRSVISS